MDITTMEVDKNTNDNIEIENTPKIDHDLLNEFFVIKPKDNGDSSAINDSSKSNDLTIEKSNNDNLKNKDNSDNNDCKKNELCENKIDDKINFFDSIKTTDNKNDDKDDDKNTDTTLNKLPEIKISPSDSSTIIEKSNDDIISNEKVNNETTNDTKDSSDSIDSITEETIIISALESSSSADDEITEETLDDTNGTIEYNLVDYDEIDDKTTTKNTEKTLKNIEIIVENIGESTTTKIIDEKPETPIKNTKLSDDKIEIKKLPIIQNKKNDNVVVDNVTSPDAKQRTLIKDIFDDWTDENNEEEINSPQELSKSHDDDVEHQLSLLDGSKQKDDDVKLPVTKKIQTSLLKINKIDCEKQKNKKDIIPTKPSIKITQIIDNKPSNSSQIITKDKINKKDDLIIKKNKDDNKSPVTIPALIPIENPDKKIKIKDNIKKKESDDNSDLLAILEGDVDPDWSDLKPTNDNQTKKTSTTPISEREIAMKQLLGLDSPQKQSPSSSSSPITPKKRLFQTKLSEELKLISALRTEADNKNLKKISTIDLTSNEKELIDNNSDIKSEETRSGRKRKPTEKAREHEISAKRQKLTKTRPLILKKNIKKNDNINANNVNNLSSIDNQDSDSNTESINERKSSLSEVEEVVDNIEKSSTPTTAKKQKDDLSLNNKKIITKKLPKTTTPTTTTTTVTTIITPPSPPPPPPPPAPVSIKKTNKKLPVKTPTKKTTMPAPTDTPKPKKKSNNEIDRLLQDEGVVNLLYDVDQPRTRRLVPVTKSQVKVMDMVKVQRELKIRTKLVKNAVLRLRTSSTSPTKISPRAKRCVSINYDQENNQQQLLTPEKLTVDKKQDNIKSPKSPTEFIYPAKIRNAADASVIVRRHSSSSFSSTSGSPRVSFDGTRTRDSLTHDNHDDGNNIRANKRRISQDNKKKIADAKKAKKQPVPVSVTIKKIDANKKTRAGSINQTDEVADKSTSNNNNKSNGNVATKNIKGKKNQKSKVSFIKEEKEDEEEDDDNDEEEEEEDDDDDDVKDKDNEPEKKENKGVKNETADGESDELSVCLAEAVTALATERSNRKSKLRNSTTNDDKKTRSSNDKIQFSNKEINVKKHGNLVQLIMTPSTNSKIRNGITLQMMEEFKDVLTILKKDDDCRVVLLTSTGSSFCEGLELSTLLHDDKDTRRTHAQELAKGVKEFIKSLATFNKPIVAGVQGTAAGLGVTMLPLFDLVIASDKASFSTPYGKLGQIAEGAAVFTLSHFLGNAVTSELLLGGRTLTANEALRAGLVSRVLWPDRFHVELLPSLRVMSDQSAQSMEATKALLRHSFRTKLDAALESECYLLIQHWCSTECQDAIRVYLDEKIQ
ncbi:myb-like protein X [Aphidius gifuensis]|nr:myb-like protein X [Aphidius gifuensis]XP_044013252.1 myb-like protein X [Aphidius gifuensis]